MLKYGRSDNRLSETKKPKAMNVAKWTSASSAFPDVTRHCTSSTATSVAVAPVTATMATNAPNRFRAASSAAMRRNSPAIPSPAASAAKIATGAETESGNATN